MKPLHAAGALLVTVVWGLNFSVIRLGLNDMTPLSFAAWRFVFGAVPVLFIARPNVPWWTLAGIGFFQFTGQFVFLFIAMQSGLPPGLTSVLVQLQGPLTVVLAFVALGERARLGQWLGLALAMAGVVLIALSVEGPTTLLAVGLGLLSALSWATGNLFMKEARGASMFAITAWASLLPPLPLMIAGVLLDGPAATFAPVLAPSWQITAVLVYTVAPAMWLGYFIWGTLLRTYPAAHVGPVSLLVPCFAFAFASAIFDEPLGGLRLAGVVVVLAGVAAASFAGSRRWLL